ncbi:MAG: Homoserine dehydrogenase [Syntrophorhabdaceae bacterium PtaU1.Bin034]|nr:MAG: Homoserine dehydrogenase [Syntrophorhabdaceae bacterium PtaU1.Bin034]
MIGIGIIGLGTVGRGTYEILRDHRSLIREKTGVNIAVVGAAEVNQERRRGFESELLFRDALDLINDPKIDIIVELVGGTGIAYEFISQAIEKKKWVVTANKALLAERGNELFGLAAEHGCEIGFEASVCGGIPVIRALRDGLVGNKIGYILGILNGTSNYILSKMTEEGLPFDRALDDARRAGFAEADPTLDIEGIDAAHKLCILTRLAFGYPISMEKIGTGGISRIEPIDIEFAREFGYKIKLLAVAKEEDGVLEVRVEPAMLPIKHLMSNVNGVYNAVYIVGDRVGPNLYYGKGAGGDPTGSAVVSDIVDMAARKAGGPAYARSTMSLSEAGRRIRKSGETVTPFYMRFKAEDRPGVLSKISGILADYNISIFAVTQKGRKENGFVSIVMLTYEATEENLRKAKAEIDRLAFTGAESVHIRIEEGEL